MSFEQGSQRSTFGGDAHDGIIPDFGTQAGPDISNLIISPDGSVAATLTPTMACKYDLEGMSCIVEHLEAHKHLSCRAYNTTAIAALRLTQARIDDVSQTAGALLQSWR